LKLSGSVHFKNVVHVAPASIEYKADVKSSPSYSSLSKTGKLQVIIILFNWMELVFEPYLFCE